MNIALIGYGKMGKAIHEIANQKNEQLGENKYNIQLIVDIENRATTTLEDLRKWIGVIWNWLGAFGDGLGGLIIVIILIGIIGGGIWKRRRISAILLDLWEQIK